MSQRVVAIIQARIGGDRLSGKVLLPLGGKSMLQNVVERVQRAKLVDEVVVAVPWGDLSKLAAIGHQTHTTFVEFSGVAENDIIGRYYKAAQGYDLIIRISADNPCVMASEIDSLITNAALFDFAKQRGLWLNSEHPEHDHDGFGGELWTLEMLEWFDKTIKAPEYRERPERFWFDMRRFSYVGRCEGFWSGFRLDVNTQANYEKLKTIYDHFGHNHFTVDEVIEFLNGKNDMEELPISS